MAGVSESSVVITATDDRIFFFFLLTFGSCIELTSSVVIGTDGSLDDVAAYAELSSATKVYGEFLP